MVDLGDLQSPFQPKLFCDSMIHFSHMHTYAFKSEQGQISLDPQRVFEAFKAKLEPGSEHFQVCVLRNTNLEFLFFILVKIIPNVRVFDLGNL